MAEEEVKKPSREFGRDGFGTKSHPAFKKCLWDRELKKLKKLKTRKK